MHNVYPVFRYPRRSPTSYSRCLTRTRTSASTSTLSSNSNRSLSIQFQNILWSFYDFLTVHAIRCPDEYIAVRWSELFWLYRLFMHSCGFCNILWESEISTFLQPLIISIIMRLLPTHSVQYTYIPTVEYLFVWPKTHKDASIYLY